MVQKNQPLSSSVPPEYELVERKWRYPYLSYIDYHCGSEGMTFYLKAELSLINNKNIPKDFNFAEVKNADIFRNFSNFPAPSEDDAFNAKYPSQHTLTTIPFLWI